ncbi:hypothetical protein KR222_000327 [Zaprionus bogoriensis]|nr:hypothetical protein KR222_000327 [Zaprionus bogoriensis]
MPHKRKSRLVFNPKRAHTRRPIGTTESAPSVCVKPDHGTDLENTLPAPGNLASAPPAAQQLKATQTTVNSLAVPQYNTTLRMQQEFNVLQSMPTVIRTQLTPRSKAAMAPTVTQKMNFPPHRAVFKGLTPLNVNDSLDEREWAKAGTSREAAVRANTGEPQLEDYLEKIEHMQLISPDPELLLEFPSEDFDFLQAYNRVYNYF